MEQTNAEMTSYERDLLREIAINEMRSGWPKFLIAYLKRVRKQAGIPALTQEHIAIINAAMVCYRPDADRAALTDSDAADIANI